MHNQVSSLVALLVLAFALALMTASPSYASPPADASEGEQVGDHKAGGGDSRTGDSEHADEQSNQSSDPRAQSYADTWPKWVASVIGAVGSLAYLVAIWVGMIGKTNEARDRLMALFRGDNKRQTAAKCSAYVVSGGLVALVFQLPETKLVAIQAFILGCTWPAVVSNYITGVQTGERGENEAQRVDEEAQAIVQVSDTADELAGPTPELTDEDLAMLKALAQPDPE